MESLSRPLFLSVFLLSLSVPLSPSQQCVVTLSLEDTREDSTVIRIAGADLSFKCIAVGCRHIGTLAVQQDGNDTSGFDHKWCRDKAPNPTYWEKICSVNVTVDYNGSNLQCIGEPGQHRSNSIRLLVLDTLDPVSNVLVKATDSSSVNISWSPGDSDLPISYTVTVCSSNSSPATVSTDQHWIHWNTSGLDECQYASISIVPFVDELMGNETVWYGPIQSPPSDINLNYTLLLSNNGTVSLTVISTEDCLCTSRRSTHITLMDSSSTISYFSHIPVTISNCTTGHITVWDESILIVDTVLLMVVWLENGVGATRQDMILSIDTHSLTDGSYTNGTSVCVTCSFTSGHLTNNHYSSGCNVSFVKLDSNLKNFTVISRENGESFVESCYTGISSSGLYELCYSALPSVNSCQLSEGPVYIHVIQSNEPTTTPSPGGDNKKFIIIVCIGGALLIAILVMVLVLLIMKLFNVRPVHKEAQLEEGDEKGELTLSATGSSYGTSGTSERAIVSLPPAAIPTDIPSSDASSSEVSGSDERDRLLRTPPNQTKSDSQHHQRKLSTVVEETSFCNFPNTAGTDDQLSHLQSPVPDSATTPIIPTSKSYPNMKALPIPSFNRSISLEERTSHDEEINGDIISF